MLILVLCQDRVKRELTVQAAPRDAHARSIIGHRVVQKYRADRPKETSCVYALWHVGNTVT